MYNIFKDLEVIDDQDYAKYSTDTINLQETT